MSGRNGAPIAQKKTPPSNGGVLRFDPHFARER